MGSYRPDPDAILAAIGSSESQRGRLKVFLGASAGVGKTYAMLSEAHELRERGVDVVIGYVEPHQREQTKALMEGLDAVPLRQVQYRGTTLEEVDVSAIVSRKPEVVLVDELAHTNAPGSTNTKRWQDIEEILNAGVSVYTAVNVQHLESLNDIVAQVTGTRIKETVPDSFFEAADEIELIDLPPAELQQRLADGKIYVPERVQHALDGFFKTSNLTALRELALRRAADSVDNQMQRLRVQEGDSRTWVTKDRIIVCIAPNRMGQRVVRAAANIAATTHAELIAVYVQSDRQENRSSIDHEQGREALELAAELGFEIVRLQGHDIVGEIIEVARRRNASLVMVGKPIKPRWKELLFGSVVDELVRASGDIDVYVITAEEESQKQPPRPRRFARPITLLGVLMIGVVVAIETALSFLLFPVFQLANVAMLYVLGVAIGATRGNRTESALLSLVSVLVFNFCFVEPRFTFAVSDSRYLLLFGVMLTIGVVISSLTDRLKQQISVATERERKTSSLYSMSRLMAQARSKLEIAQGAANEITSVFGGEIAVHFAEDGKLLPMVSSKSGFERLPTESGAVSWVLANKKVAGLGTDTLPGASAVFLPLRGADMVVGVLGWRPQEAELPTEQMQLLETFLNGLGLALERAILAKSSNDARVDAESEKIRSTLLSSISHDLRTPLTSITGAASSLMSGTGDQKELATTIHTEATRLNHQIQNLLDMTRLQSGNVEPKLEWQSPADLVSIALEKAGTSLQNHFVKVDIKGNPGLIRADALLVEKALVNLMENAAKFSPAASQITITVFAQTKEVIFLVADQGAGFPPEQVSRAFQAGVHTGTSGFGLGLAIVESIAKLHGGRVSATNAVNGGALVRLEFPLPDQQPLVPND